MEQSILTSTKKILGIAESYTIFDLDIITHINATFSVLHQLGIGPSTGFMIEDATPVWTSYGPPSQQLNFVKTYMFLRVKKLFDPPTTSFLIEATDKQIAEFEWRLNVMREELLHPFPAPAKHIRQRTVVDGDERHAPRRRRGFVEPHQSHSRPPEPAMSFFFCRLRIGEVSP